MTTHTSARTSARGERAVRPLLTATGARQLAERVADIRQRRLVELAPLLVEHERDERNVAEFEYLLALADDEDAFLASAEILELDPASFDGHVALGMRVQVRLVDDSKAWVRPVHPREAVLDDERISVTSPLGVALVGARLGDEVVVDAPVGTWTCRILAVELSDGTVKRAPRRRRPASR